MQHFKAERDEVGAALWSHVCVVVVVEDPLPPLADPPPSHDHVMDGMRTRPLRWRSVLVRLRA